VYNAIRFAKSISAEDDLISYVQIQITRRVFVNEVSKICKYGDCRCRACDFLFTVIILNSTPIAIQKQAAARGNLFRYVTTLAFQIELLC
jgi:hypothetical protein